MTGEPPPPRITDASAAAALFADLRGAPTEQAVVALLDPEWRILDTLRFVGDRCAVTPSLRAIVAAALRLDAAALVLLHNHPSGSARPSADDLAFTRTLARVTGPLGLMLVDHLILAGGDTVSFREMGLL